MFRVNIKSLNENNVYNNSASHDASISYSFVHAGLLLFNLITVLYIIVFSALKQLKFAIAILTTQKNIHP